MLAVGVLGDVDVQPHDAGVAVEGSLVDWRDIAATVGPDDPLSTSARRRVERLLRLQARLDREGDAATALLAQRLRVIALPRGHADHLGRLWVADRLLGGALDLGLGVLGLLDDPDEVVPLPPSVSGAADLPRGTWARVLAHADEMGALCVARLERDGARGHGVLRPVGGCDVLALLASRSLRTWLANGDGSGLRALAVPMRNRGWYDLAHIDPVFVGAAWAASAENERGIAAPLLVTADEVGLGRADPTRPVRALPRQY